MFFFRIMAKTCSTCETPYLGHSQFAYFSYLITKAIRDKTPITMLIAGVVVLSYGGLLFSLGQFQSGVSWTGHVCGFASGIILALYGPKQLR